MKTKDDSDVRALLESGQLEKAERIARARVAKYAIWIRQHTALSINADRQFAEMITPIDAHALEHELDLLAESVSASGHAEAMLFTYRRPPFGGARACGSKVWSFGPASIHRAKARC